MPLLAFYRGTPAGAKRVVIAVSRDDAVSDPAGLDPECWKLLPYPNKGYGLPVSIDTSHADGGYRRSHTGFHHEIRCDGLEWPPGSRTDAYGRRLPAEPHFTAAAKAEYERLCREAEERIRAQWAQDEAAEKARLAEAARRHDAREDGPRDAWGNLIADIDD